MTSTTLDTRLLPKEIVGMLRRSFGAHAAKVMAHYADVSIRTAQNWIQGRSIPQLDKAMLMMRHPVFYAEMRDWMDLAIQQENAIRERLQALDAPVASVAQRSVEGVGFVGDGSRGELPGPGAATHRPLRRAA